MKQFILVVGILATCYVHAQPNRQTVFQNHGWYMFFGNHALGGKWLLHTEYQYRRSEIIRAWQQSLTRVGIDYRLNDVVTLTAGYAFIRTFPYGEQPLPEEFDEHRLWQTLTLQHANKRFLFNHRYRLEQRWLERFSSDPADGPMYLNRIRYRFMFTLPLNKPTLQPGTFFLNVYDEVFIGFGRNVAKNVVDQNRLYAGFGYRFNQQGNVQLGWMNQTVIKRDGVLQEQNRTLMVALTYNLDFRKKTSKE